MPEVARVPGIVLFCAGAVVGPAASWLLVQRLERAGFSEAWLGLVAALAADAPEDQVFGGCGGAGASAVSGRVVIPGHQAGLVRS